VERDIAVIVAESVTHAALMGAIRGAATQGLLRDATLFDVYKPQQASASMQLGEKSLAVRLTLSSDSRYTDRRGDRGGRSARSRESARPARGAFACLRLPRNLPKIKTPGARGHAAWNFL
jgi:hypothetical protein